MTEKIHNSPRIVSREQCSSCTGEPHTDNDGRALFCADCVVRAHADEERYDIGRGGQPDATATLRSEE